jgi:hypothetical protein
MEIMAITIFTHHLTRYEAMIALKKWQLKTMLY